MEAEVLSVSELRDFINQTLSYAYPLVTVQGEVSGYRINQGKWVFFDLKDADTTISCFMTIHQLKTVLEDGMLVRVTATPNLTKWGKFSLTVKAVELAGEGEVRRAFELLKAQFEAEGLFDVSRKRPLPEYPQKIGLVTSAEAAAYNDFVTIARDRWPLVELHHAHVHVQGVQAPVDVVAAIRTLNTRSDLEAIVVVRGGGSAEDLQAFNHEDVVRAVYGSHLPTIVGIGHEDDVSLAELAADVRAATPTDAARRLLPDQREVRRRLTEQASRQHQLIATKVDRLRHQLEAFHSHMRRVHHLANLRIAELSRRLDQVLTQRLQAWHYALNIAARTLAAVDPQAVLARGFAIVRVGDTVVHRPDQIGTDDDVLVQLHEGQVTLHRGDNHGQDSQTRLDFS